MDGRPFFPERGAAYILIQHELDKGKRLVLEDLVDFSRAFLLAFADLGAYLQSDTQRLFAKVNCFVTGNPDALSQFLLACTHADLVQAEPGGYRLAPAQARALALSFDGHTPVPDAQAFAWARILERFY